MSEQLAQGDRVVQQGSRRRDRPTDQKVAALNSIGNVAWSKLNSKTLDIADSIELADFGLGAVQRGRHDQAEARRNSTVCKASILNFQVALTQGASSAAPRSIVQPRKIY